MEPRVWISDLDKFGKKERAAWARSGDDRNLFDMFMKLIATDFALWTRITPPYQQLLSWALTTPLLIDIEYDDRETEQTREMEASIPRVVNGSAC
jgi:hypothetical protein